MSKPGWQEVEIRADGVLATCMVCGAPTTKVCAVEGVPRDIAKDGRLNVPYCDACFAKSGFKKNEKNDD